MHTGRMPAYPLQTQMHFNMVICHDFYSGHNGVQNKKESRNMCLYAENVRKIAMIS